MASQFWPKEGSPGILHHYTETLVAFEFTSGSVPKPHSVLFVGGLGDGLATTSYVSDVVRALAPTGWSLFSLTLTSSYQSWGLGHLDRDTDELAACLTHIRAYKASKFGGAPGGKVVLMGHSTGSQCVLHYLYRPNPHVSTPAFDPELTHAVRPALDGAVMQAPVSDREAMQWVLHDPSFLGKTPAQAKALFDRILATAREAARQKGRVEDTLLPLSMTGQVGYPPNTPLSCRRFLSLVSPDSPERPAEDDLFSSDLPDARLDETFGAVRDRGLLRGSLMVLYSGADQSVPDWVDKEKLLARWRDAADKKGRYQVWDKELSGVIPGASHALSNDDQAEPRRILVERVLKYLSNLTKD